MNLLTGHIVENSWSTWVNISPAPYAANTDHVTVRIVEQDRWNSVDDNGNVGCLLLFYDEVVGIDTKYCLVVAFIINPVVTLLTAKWQSIK